jgi:uncharacterized membrane protein YhdT
MLHQGIPKRKEINFIILLQVVYLAVWCIHRMGTGQDSQPL